MQAELNGIFTVSINERRIKKMDMFKAQWPLATNEEPHILIYKVKKPDVHWLLKATPEMRTQLFEDKYVRVFFIGKIMKGQIYVKNFCSRERWL